ncbi:MAG: hypothetical protein M1834_003960 [Cirrosporium novae-zelandiae]|nr:MAG: hypothetical protein M1834_003960 [Cirrosporium novae-zelandiae]
MSRFLWPTSNRSVFDHQTPLEHFLTSPLKFLVRHVYALILLLRGPSYHPPRDNSRLRVVCISDTHCETLQSVPPGDILIHSGDLTNAGNTYELQAHIDWLKTLPHTQKLVICGNHDSYFDPRSRSPEDNGKTLDWGNIHYLQHNSITLTFPSHNNRTFNIYGAPQIPLCGGSSFAFQYRRYEDAWTDTIPPDTDILITHAPPRFHLDLPVSLGCKFLLSEVWKVQPILHVFGHVHAAYGRENAFWDDFQWQYENVCSAPHGGLRELFSPTQWFGLARVIYYGIGGILWNRVWRGDSHGSVFINASNAYRSSGKVGNKPQVIDI